MNEINTNVGNANGYPPIILQNRKPEYCFSQTCPPDSFEKPNQQFEPIIIDPNDKFVKTVDNNIKNLSVEHQMLGAKFNPKETKKVMEEAWKWGKRIWGAAEIYDTIDGYRERFNKDNV